MSVSSVASSSTALRAQESASSAQMAVVRKAARLDRVKAEAITKQIEDAGRQSRPPPSRRGGTSGRNLDVTG